MKHETILQGRGQKRQTKITVRVYASPYEHVEKHIFFKIVYPVYDFVEHSSAIAIRSVDQDFK